MHSAEDVLELLAQKVQTPLSGEIIAQKLNISRNAVWKAVNILKKQGFTIQASTKCGYILLDDVVTKAGIEAGLPGVEVRILPEVSSTNYYIKAEAEVNKEGLVVIARRQSAGRGRLGRQFASPPYTGLYMSLLLKPKMKAEQAVRITTMAAVAVCRAIESCTDKQAQIKWVNDVFVDGRKVCGILTEASVNFENGEMAYAVLGIGVNLYEPADGFAEEIKDVAGAVFQPNSGPHADRFACELLRQFFLLYNGGEYIEEYRQRSFLMGKQVTYTLQGKEKKGLVIGLDDACGLIVRTENGQEVLRSGEVSVRYDKNEIKNR